MGIVARLARSTPPSSSDPLREVLRKAIEAHDQAKRERDRITSTLEKSQQRCLDFLDVIDKLAAEVTMLVDTRVERIAARVLDGKDLVDRELKDAQQRLADAEETKIAADAAHEVLEKSAENAENILRLSKERMENAAAAILLPLAGEVEDRIRSLLNDLSPLFAQLSFLQTMDRNIYPSDDCRQRQRLLNDPMRAVPCYGKYRDDPIVAPAIEPLRKAYVALQTDANAAVPDV